MNLGVSIVELLVVVAIIGILATIGIVVYNNFIKNTKIVGTDATYVQTAKKIHTEYDAFTGNLNVTSMYSDYFDGKTEQTITCGEYMYAVKRYYETAGATNFFNSTKPLIECADETIKVADFSAGGCSCDTCVDIPTLDTPALGSILLVCLDGDNLTYGEGFGMQVILNNAD